MDPIECTATQYHPVTALCATQNPKHLKNIYAVLANSVEQSDTFSKIVAAVEELENPELYTLKTSVSFTLMQEPGT